MRRREKGGPGREGDPWALCRWRSWSVSPWRAWDTAWVRTRRTQVGFCTKALEKQHLPFPVGTEEARGVNCLPWTPAGQAWSDRGPAAGDADSPKGRVPELLTRPWETDAANTNCHKFTGLKQCSFIVSRFSR